MVSSIPNSWWQGKCFSKLHIKSRRKCRSGTVLSPGLFLDFSFLASRFLRFKTNTFDQISNSASSWFLKGWPLKSIRTVASWVRRTDFVVQNPGAYYGQQDLPENAAADEGHEVPHCCSPACLLLPPGAEVCPINMVNSHSFNRPLHQFVWQLFKGICVSGHHYPLHVWQPVP